MEELFCEQQVRLECVMSAMDMNIAMIEKFGTTIDVYELSEKLYKYIMDREIPKSTDLN